MAEFLPENHLRTKVRKLMELGIPKDFAIMTGASRKSYWHLSKGYATNAAMPNEWYDHHYKQVFRSLGSDGWDVIVQEFLRAQKSFEKLKAFYNTRLGLPFKVRGKAPKWKAIYARHDSYLRGTVPQGGLVLTAGADVQEDRIECEVIARGRDKRSFSVDYYVFPGRTDTVNSPAYDGLARLMNRAFPGLDEKDVIVKKIGH